MNSLRDSTFRLSGSCNRWAFARLDAKSIAAAQPAALEFAFAAESPIMVESTIQTSRVGQKSKALISPALLTSESAVKFGITFPEGLSTKY
ncbi:hypothetical protein M5K25_007425 [Dendrobium thyrsiflorum]|uniref:Uncharacterized protein n=1 Tax=Dendrobium thyrsiflorum TaxID=117978 RepID=A0ABD0VFF7_DENTH